MKPQHNDNYVEEDDNYLFAETIEEEEVCAWNKGNRND
jgi:hypothetical protein